MRILERPAPSNELSNMVERIMNHQELLDYDPHMAKVYWNSVQRTYTELGYEAAEVYILMCAAAETIQNAQQEIEEMTNGRQS